MSRKNPSDNVFEEYPSDKLPASIYGSLEKPREIYCLATYLYPGYREEDLTKKYRAGIFAGLIFDVSFHIEIIKRKLGYSKIDYKKRFKESLEFRKKYDEIMSDDSSELSPEKLEYLISDAINFNPLNSTIYSPNELLFCRETKFSYGYFLDRNSDTSAPGSSFENAIIAQSKDHSEAVRFSYGYLLKKYDIFSAKSWILENKRTIQKDDTEKNYEIYQIINVKSTDRKLVFFDITNCMASK